MALRLDKAQRAFIADKLMDSANLALGGMVFGQLIARTIELSVLLLGIVIYLSSWGVSLFLEKGVNKQ